MTPYNNLVHYIWVGENPIPNQFLLNYENTKLHNTTYNFILWRDKDIMENDSDYAELYQSSKLFHKLQIARYTIMHKFGGIYTDFDINWKMSFNEVYAMFDDTVNVVLPKRNSLHFYNRGIKTTLIDDFVIFAKPGIMKNYLLYCNDRTEERDNETEPFSVYALTEWLLTQTNVDFLTHQQIDTDENSLIAVHTNKKTWRNIS